MATRVRITIEYDLDLEADAVATPEILQAEALAWINGELDVNDVIACEGPEAFRLEVVG